LSSTIFNVYCGLASVVKDCPKDCLKWDKEYNNAVAAAAVDDDF